MKRYKLLTQAGYPSLERGQTYDEDFVSAVGLFSVKNAVRLHPKDWQLVNESDVKTFKTVIPKRKNFIKVNQKI